MNIMRGHDQRRYNNPTRMDEVAAIFVSPDGAPPVNRDIVIYPKNQQPRKISYLSGNIDPMVYPIFFPTGILGWFPGMEHIAERATERYRKVSCLHFYAYRLAVGMTGFNPIFHGGKLLQQYVVDAYVRTESTRIGWVLQNQKQLRVELYQGLMHHIHQQATLENRAPRKIVILPSSFQGSPRCMQQSFQDAMAIVSKYGRPDLFLTFTCNPKCQDITDALQPNQQAHDRTDIVSRVFKLHLQELLHDIRNNHALGVPVAFVYVIEFQKRGLPHCHLLIILNEDSKLKEAADIDSIISAEIPNEQSQTELFRIVKTTMVHGPCGPLNPASPCMIDGKCSKDYPKAYQQETSLAVNGYPLYRRQDNGRTITLGNRQVDNRWIVPYNPYLSRKFNAHINLEACTSIKSVKYLFKYVYKGHDCANIRITETDELTHDEVHTYIDTRYVSAPEAFWRLSQFKLHEQSHSIYRLAIHLPHQQPVYFQEGAHEEAAHAAECKDTMLTAYFKVNALSQTPYLYTEFPQHYVWNKTKREWTVRKQRGDKVLPRIYSISPKDSEKYCLRILLHHVPGATSFDDLKTVDGEVMETFKDACIRRQLLTDDKEWDHAMTEAATFQMPRQLRTLFATILIYCNPQDPLQLWEKHKATMMEDFTDLRHMTLETAQDCALNHIQSTLEQSGFTCKDFSIPQFNPNTLAQDLTADPGFDITQESNEAKILLNILNNEQQQFVDQILGDLADIKRGDQPKCRAYFLDGPGGTGKTMCYNTLISAFRGEGEVVAPCAWTGIAATLLKGGRTVHNLFKLPVPVLDTSTCNVKPTSKHAAFLRNVVLFIIDEASMIPSNALQAVDRMLRDITSVDVPFGGKIFIMGGDFRQVLPVVPRKPPAVIVENCIKRSKLWPAFRIHRLIKNMRAQEDEQDFAQWLLRLGNGLLRYNHPDIPHCIQIPPDCEVVKEHLETEVFINLQNPRLLSNTVILTPTNQYALRMNDDITHKLPGTIKVYLSADQVICEDPREAEQYPLEFLNSITPTGMPPHRLLLKPGVIIMLLRNLDIKRGLCNGTRLIVRNLHTHVLDAEILTGANKGDYVLIPRIKLAPSDVNLPFILERTQFPVRVSYCMTINKAQGQTFDKVGLYLPQPVFSHGQLYVAFSRSRRFSDITVQIIPTTKQGFHNDNAITQNIVYQEVL